MSSMNPLLVVHNVAMFRMFYNDDFIVEILFARFSVTYLNTVRYHWELKMPHGL